MSKSTAAFRSEVLGFSAAKSGKTPVAVMAVRLNPKENFKAMNLMFDRPTLERIVEDITHLLNTSYYLSEGEHNDTTLADVEQIHLSLN